MESDRKLKIWILNHHARLVGHRHYEIARQLIKMGADVTVFASSFLHSEHKYLHNEIYIEQEIQPCMRYIWLRTRPAYQNSVLRILNMLDYYFLVKRYYTSVCERYGNPDVVIGSSVHPFAWEIAYLVAKKTQATFFAEVRDFWPKTLIELKGMSRAHPLVKLFGLIEKRAYQRASRIITTMPYGDKYICNELGYPKEKVLWLPNGIDIEENNRAVFDPNNTLPKELGCYLRNHKCCVYTGSLVESECVDFILDAAVILKKIGRNDIFFAIIGNGLETMQLIQKAQEKKLLNVRFFERITKKQVALALREAWVCLAAIKDLTMYRYGLSMNKLNDYLSSGAPTVFACAVNNVVGTSGAGIVVNPGDVNAYAEAIIELIDMEDCERRLMGDSGKKTIETTYDIKLIAKTLFNEILESRRVEKK